MIQYQSIISELITQKNVLFQCFRIFILRIILYQNSIISLKYHLPIVKYFRTFQIDHFTIIARHIFIKYKISQEL